MSDPAWWTREAGRERRARLNERAQNALDAAQYYLGPGIPVNRLAELAGMVNPVMDLELMDLATQRAMQTEGGERWRSVAEAGQNALTFMLPALGAGVGARMAASRGGALADDGARAASALADTFANTSQGGRRAAREFAADESGMFAGVRAQTADTGALRRAQEMQERGASRDEIWRETGWFQGVDGRWRFEIDDSAATLTQRGRRETFTADMDEVIDHEALFAAYPDLRRVYAQADSATGSGRGSWQFPESREHLGLFDLDEAMTVGGAGRRSTTLHELQHGVQGREGFARGASPREYTSGPMFDRRARDLNSDFAREMTGGVSGRPAEYLDSLHLGDQQSLLRIARKHGFESVEDAAAFLRRQDDLRSPFSQYQRTAGEVEARNVQARRNMTPEQRRETPPWQTQDTPDADQIVRFGADRAESGWPAARQRLQEMGLIQ